MVAAGSRIENHCRPLYVMDQARARQAPGAPRIASMALRLTVVSDQRDALGGDASIVLGVGGGSIGRAHDNDWVLPDTQCYLSAHHARVQFRSGSYYLLDTSTNGTYVNGGTVALRRRNIYPLRDGDSLRLGQYHIAVSIDPDPDPAEAAAFVPAAAETPANPARRTAVASGAPGTSEAPEASSIFPIAELAAAAAPADIGASLDLRQLLHPDAEASPGHPNGHGSGNGSGNGNGSGANGNGGTSRIGPVDAFGQSVLVRSIPIDDSGLRAFDRSGQQRLPAAAAATATATTTAAPADGGRGERRSIEELYGRHPGARYAGTDTAALEALCRGAGLDARRLPAQTHPGLLYLAGLLLREALAALKGLALTQRELRDQTHIDVGREEPQHIGLTGLPVEDLLLRLLLGHSRHELDAVQWLRDTAAGSRGHELALMRALPAALSEFVARLDPVALSHSAAEAAASAGEAAPTGVTARFRTITDMPSGSLPQLFAEAFARAFAAEYRRNVRDH
jgi:type VI secretion system protein